MRDFPLILIPLLPLAGAAINLLFGKRLGRGAATLIGVGSVAAAMILGWWAAWLLSRGGESAALTANFFDGDWIHATEQVPDASLHITAGLLLDRLSSVMVLVITTVGFLIHVYSAKYMEDDPHVTRYFGYLNLFTGAMLILVLGDSLPVTFVGWEGVGLCSYLLIGFWFDKEQNAYAGRKAFIVNRIGDFGFLLGMFLVFSAASTLKYSDLAQAANTQSEMYRLLSSPFLVNGASYATFAAILLFIGACGKSAQLPLYVWLPDAMAGPTPVSALIHAATMVTAGVYMVARLHPLFGIDYLALGIVASVGAATALFAATIGVAQKPIKKILAYSTVSQLGFMFVGVASPTGYSAGVFHLVTHAFFKAGLFLGAGSIMHALGGLEDVTQMGGLRKKMPVTFWTFVVYCLAIAGIVPFSGFFSKDAILARAWEFEFPEREVFAHWHWLGHAIYFVGLAAALLTAFYMFRCLFLVFFGKWRGDEKTWEHAHESPPTMTVPLVVLAIGAAVLGFFNLPEAWHEGGGLFDAWLPAAFSPPPLHGESTAKEWVLMGVATAVSLAGIGLAWVLYGRGPSPAVAKVPERAPRLYRVVYNKYYVDEIYDFLIVRPLRAIAYVLWKVVDALLIDLVLVRGSALVVDLGGRALRYLQNGDVQRYVVGVLVGTTALVWVGVRWVAWTAAGFEVETAPLAATVHPRGIPAAVARPLDYTIDFGDGAVEKQTTAGTPSVRHHYQAPGKKTITVTVIDPRWDTEHRVTRTVEVPK